MKITCKLGKGNIKVVEVSPEDPLYVLLDKLNIKDKTTKILYEGKTYEIGNIITFREIGITADDIIIINNPINSLKIKITCKLGTRNIKVVEVSPEDPLFVLLYKLNISDKTTKFIYKGISYSLGSLQTFKEIGLTCDARILVNNNQYIG